MSWLGGSFSSITDQLTNFTKEVLTEGREEISDHVTELNIASRRIQELEVQCTTYRQEIERIRRRNTELEERCQATELQVNSVSSQYRSLLQQKEDELLSLKQKHHDLLEPATDALASPTSSGGFRFHGDDEADLGDLITSQLEINRLATEVRKLRAEREHWKSERRSTAADQQLDEQYGQENNPLLARIKELEKNLREATDLSHNQVATLQDHYEQRLVELQQTHQARLNELQKQLQLYQRDSSEPATPGTELRGHLVEMEKKLEEGQRKIEVLKKEQREKEKNVQLLSRQLDKVQVEKTQLSEELKSSNAELEGLKQKYLKPQRHSESDITERKPQRVLAPSPVAQGNEDEQTTTTEVIQEIQDTRTKLSSGAASIQSQLLLERQNIVDQMLETEKQKVQLKNWLGTLEAEKYRLSDEIKTLIHSLGKDELLGYINALEEENVVLKSQSKEADVPLPEGERISLLRPEPLGESLSDTQDAHVHSSHPFKPTFGSGGSVEEDAESEASDISTRNRELCEQVRLLREQVTTYEKELERMHWELSREKCLEVHTSTNEQQKSIKDQHSEESMMQDDPIDLKEELSVLTKENTQLASNNKAMKTENEIMLEKLSSARKLNEELQSSLQKQDHSEDLREILEEKEAQIHELMEEKLSLEISLEELDAQHQEAMEKILFVKKDLLETNKKLNRQVQELQEKAATQEEEIGYLKVETETLQEQIMAMAKKPQQDTESVSTSLEGSPQKQLKPIFEAINSINADNLELEEKLATLEAQRRDHEVALLKAETLRQEDKAAKDCAENECLSLNNQLELLRASLAEASSSKEEEKMARAVAEEECASLKVQLKEMESIVLERGGGDQQQQQVSDTELVARVQELTSEKENLQNEADDLWTRMIATSQETETLNLEISNLQLANRRLQEELERVQVQHQQDLQGMEDLEKSCARQRDEDQQKLEVSKTEVVKLKEELSILGVQRQQEVQDLKRKFEVLENASGRDLKQELEVDKLKKELTLRQQDIQDMAQKIEILEKSSGKNLNEELMKQEVETLKKKLNEIKTLRQQELQTMQEMERGFAKEHKENQLREEALRSEIAKLTAVMEDSVEDACESDQFKGDDKKTAAEYLSHIDRLEQELEELKEMRLNPNYRSKAEAEVQVTDNDAIESLHSMKLSLQQKDLTIEELQNQLSKAKLEIAEKVNSNVDNHSSLGTKNVNDLVNVLKQKDAEIGLLNAQLESMQRMEGTDEASNGTEQKLKSLELEKEQMMSVMNEKSRECSSLKAEVHRLLSVVSAEKQALSKLQLDNQELMKQQVAPNQEMTKEAVQKLSRLIKDKDIEAEALQQKNQTLLQFIQQSASGSECLETLLQEKEELSKQVLTYQSEREQIISILQQKHQESLQYHGEVQRLNGVLFSECQKYESLQQQYQSVSQSFEEKQKTLINTQNELVALKARVSELERQHSDLRQRYVQILEKDPEVVQVRRDEYEAQLATLEQLTSKAREDETLMREKDRHIYDLSQEVHEAKEETSRKDNLLTSLQNRLENSGFQLNEAQRQATEAGHGSETLRKETERLQEECAMLKETDRSLSMMVKQLEFERNAMQEKVQTMTQILQQQSTQSEDTGKMLENREALEKQAQELHQERDQTVLALNQKQAENVQLQAELHKLQEHTEKLKKELDRLRHHLLEVQENYTQEALLAEDREKNLRNRLAQAEEKASVSSTAILNASQQANFQVESLQRQLSKLAQEREHALELVSQLEDRVQERAAGTTNLQLALEQIQRDHKRELQETKKQQRVILEREQEKQQVLTQKIAEMQNQLTATSDALDAASRLSEQLDRKEVLICALKDEVSTRDASLQKAVDEIQEMKSHTEGKVDKQVMKNLVLGYFGSPNSQKPEVVRLLARVLDFGQDEMSKIGLKLGKSVAVEDKPSGWLSWIVRSPPKTISASTSPSTAPTQLKESFTAQFVQFLQDESQPRPQIRLPIDVATTTKRPSRGTIQIPGRQGASQSTNPNMKNQTHFSEHPLMKPISTTLPTFAPLLVEGASKSNSFLQEVLK